MHTIKTQRTTLNLPLELIEEVQNILHTRNKTETIILALSEIARRQKLMVLTKKLAGNVQIDLTQTQLKKIRKDRI